MKFIVWIEFIWISENRVEMNALHVLRWRLVATENRSTSLSQYKTVFAKLWTFIHIDLQSARLVVNNSLEFR